MDMADSDSCAEGQQIALALFLVCWFICHHSDPGSLKDWVPVCPSPLCWFFMSHYLVASHYTRSKIPVS